MKSPPKSRNQNTTFDNSSGSNAADRTLTILLRLANQSFGAIATLGQLGLGEMLFTSKKANQLSVAN